MNGSILTKMKYNHQTRQYFLKVLTNNIKTSLKKIFACFVDFEKVFKRVGLWQTYGTIIEILYAGKRMQSPSYWIIWKETSKKQFETFLGVIYNINVIIYCKLNVLSKAKDIIQHLNTDDTQVYNSFNTSSFEKTYPKPPELTSISPGLDVQKQVEVECWFQ